MAPKASGNPVAILIKCYREGATNAVDVIPCERATENGAEYVRTPETVGGIFSKGTLCWRAYRESVSHIPLTLGFSGPTYRDAYSVDEDDVQAMAKAFRTIRKRMGGLRDQLGHAEEFGEQVMRIAACFRAEWIVVSLDFYRDVTGHAMPHAKGRWRWIETKDARHFLSGLRDIDLPKDDNVAPEDKPNCLTPIKGRANCPLPDDLEDVWHETGEGLLPEGWYATPTTGGRRGPYPTEDAALES